MKMEKALGFLLLLPVIASLCSCGHLSQHINTKREHDVVAAAAMIVSNSASNSTMDGPDKYLGNGMWFLGKPKYELQIYYWPSGPYAIYNIKTKSWRYEE